VGEENVIGIERRFERLQVGKQNARSSFSYPD
jgi:hypothetical protein